MLPSTLSPFAARPTTSGRPFFGTSGPTPGPASCSAAATSTSSTSTHHNPAPAGNSIGFSQQRSGHGFSLRQQRGALHPRSPTRGAPQVSFATDYAQHAPDGGVLLREPKEELEPAEIRSIFGFQRDLRKCYDVGKVLGAGSFGIVREARDIATGRMYACKTIPKVPKRGKSSPRYLLKLRTEVDAMRQLGASLDAVFLKDVFEDDENVHLVMELCSGGNILDRVERSSYTEKRIARIVRSILRFIAQSHAKGIIYRDVKPDNFLFLTEEADSPVKATDFGLSIRHAIGDENLKSRSGTPAYMAPEVIMQDYSHKADLWSVGILMYQLLTGRFPFWANVRNCTLQQVWKAILLDDIDLDGPALKRAMSRGARDLLKQLLVRNPELRLSAAQALEHPWVKESGVAPDVALGGSVVQRLQRFATYGHLKQLVLKIIADQIEGEVADQESAEMMAALRSLFDALDRDSSGSISGEELGAGLRAQGYSITDAEWEQLMQRVDQNSDGVIVWDEFAASLLDWRKLQEDKKWHLWVDTAFAQLDANGDGYLSLEELLDKLPLSEEAGYRRMVEAQRMLREADTNADGRISREEFIQLMVGENSIPDSLEQYDSRLTAHRPVDDDAPRAKKKRLGLF